MKRRLFVAIGFPRAIQERIGRWQELWRDRVPCRWTPKSNIHITLQFLGWLDEKYCAELEKALGAVAVRHAPFSLLLRNISYGPPNAPRRMIWLNGEVSVKLRALVADVRQELSKLSCAGEMHRESRELAAHVTLARLTTAAPGLRSRASLPDIAEPFAYEIPVRDIALMESHLARAGPTYAKVATFPLLFLP